MKFRSFQLVCVTLALSSCGGTSPDATTPLIVLPAASARGGSPSPASTPTPTSTNGFDAAWYLAQYPDVKAAGIDPLADYTANGRWEGRLPYAGAQPWRPTQATDYIGAPPCQLTFGNAWVPAGAKAVYIPVSATRFGEPCEYSQSIAVGVVNPGGTDVAQIAGVGWMNISGYGDRTLTPETLLLPSSGSRGYVAFTLPAGQQGYFHAYGRPVENTMVTSADAIVVVGGTKPDGYVDGSAAPASAAPMAAPQLGTPDYQTNLLNETFSEHRSDNRTAWSTQPTARQINGMLGVWPAADWKTVLGQSIDVLPIVTDAAGVRVRALQVIDQRSDPVVGPGGQQFAYAAPFLSRVLGDGMYGYRRVVRDRRWMPGSDSGLWGIDANGGWPPERDTDESFFSNRLAQTDHFPTGGTISFSPLGQTDGKHEYLEQIDPQVYRLWLDGVLKVEHPNYLAGRAMDTILSIEGPGGAGGGYDVSRPYGSLRTLIYDVSWWQR